MLGLTPQPRKPDYQPPQTLAGHVAPRGNPEDGRHVTATSLPRTVETGGPGAPPRAPSYRWRTVKGHCVEVSGDEEFRWALDGKKRFLISFWEEPSSLYKPIPGKRHGIVSLAILNLFL